MNYYERYCGDYAKKTAHLSLAAHGAYTLMLDHYYANERALPAAFPDLYRLCRAMSAAERASVREVADEFFPLGEDGLRHNTRADKDLEKALRRIESARKNGLLGAPTGPPSSPPNGAAGSPHMVKPPHATRHTPSKPKASAAAPPGLPVSQELWEQFRETRRKLKAPMTPYAEGLLVKELIAIVAAGGDAVATVEQSIKRGWKGFFPVDAGRKDGNGADRWWDSEAGTVAKGNELGISPNPGEAMNDFRGRVRQRIGQ